MSEKKSFKLNGAIVKLNQMPMAMAEQAVDISLAAIKDNNTERVRHLLACTVHAQWCMHGDSDATHSQADPNCLPQEIASQIKAQMVEANAGTYVRDVYGARGCCALWRVHLADGVGCRWHCFVGRKFGCYVTHESQKFIYFYVGQMGVCLFAS